jgi:hypothetical protein
MNFKNFKGNVIIIHHIFPPDLIKIGSRWMNSGGGIVTITSVNKDIISYKQCDGSINNKDSFAFQCRYCKIVDMP